MKLFYENVDICKSGTLRAPVVRSDCYGISSPIIEYQTAMHIEERAQKLLADVTLNVGDVARLARYEDPGYFARRFRQKTGVSPRKWRNDHRSKNSVAKERTGA